MSQQNNGLIYTMLAIFMLLAGGLGAVAAMRHSTASQKESELVQIKRDKTQAEDALRKEQDKVSTLLTLIGREGSDVGTLGNENPNTVAGAIQDKIKSPRLTDNTQAAKNLEAAVEKAATDRDIQANAAVQRQEDLQRHIDELANIVESKDGEINVQREGREKAEADLLEKEREHAEQLTNINAQFNQLQAELDQARTEFTEFKENALNELALLEQDNRDKREALLTLRQELFEKDDVSFATEDGIISSVDQGQLLAYINLGQTDGLREGTTFSVYVSSHGGIGRRNTDDIKARIQVVSIMGPHLAKARITYQDRSRPIAKGDPIYSPTFTSGLPMEVAITGLVDFNGTPGSDRDELLSLITQHGGARVSVQVDENGNFITQHGEAMTQEEAVNAISHTTRFLIIGDLGQDANGDSKDEKRLDTYQAIQLKTALLQQKAENHGVYEVSLATFLEFLGYTRQHQVFRSGQIYPRHLANGARSPSTRTTAGSRQSSAAISPLFSNRRRARTPSIGNVSELFE
jgi:hypothetical protein